MSRHPLGAEPTGLALRTHINARNKTLFDVARFSLTDLGGTANDVTAVLVPDFDGDGLVAGMTFGVTWAETNTGGMTLKINDAAAAPLLDRAGAAIPAGGVTAGLRSTVEYVGGAFRVLTGVITDMSATSFLWVFEADGTWTAPDGFPDDRMVWVEGWGAGGGGGSGVGGGGGGGGAYGQRILRLGDLGASVTVTVPAGGAVNTAGASSSFGSHLVVPGGGRSNSLGGGGGAGTSQGGGNSSANNGGGGGFQGGGDGGTEQFEGLQQRGQDAGGLWGGGGGGTGSNTTSLRHGGRAVFGGGGGGGYNGGGNGGSSLYGGAGGDSNTAGAPRGGGGGRNAAGGRGEIRVWL